MQSYRLLDLARCQPERAREKLMKRFTCFLLHTKLFDLYLSGGLYRSSGTEVEKVVRVIDLRLFQVFVFVCAALGKCKHQLSSFE